MESGKRAEPSRTSPAGFGGVVLPAVIEQAITAESGRLFLDLPTLRGAFEAGCAYGYLGRHDHAVATRSGRAFGKGLEYGTQLRLAFEAADRRADAFRDELLADMRRLMKAQAGTPW